MCRDRRPSLPSRHARVRSSITLGSRQGDAAIRLWDSHGTFERLCRELCPLWTKRFRSTRHSSAWPLRLGDEFVAMYRQVHGAAVAAAEDSALCGGGFQTGTSRSPAGDVTALPGAFTRLGC